MIEVFRAFLGLGLTSFGGPLAHLGYFRREFVERRAWLDERLFAHLVAFCSILPGPTSSQVGMLIGLQRAGAGGAFAAWLGFTLPSACALTAFALVLEALAGPTAATSPGWLNGAVAGLGAAAAGIVAQALLGMARTLCTDRATQTIAGVAALAALAAPWQWLPIALGAAAGAFFCRSEASRDTAPAPLAVPRAIAGAAGVAFIALVAAAAFGAHRSQSGLLLATIVRAGALVFGGGHVVLPLLQSLVPAGLVGGRDFYAGYGATQAMPGPLFTFAAFLGAANRSPLHGIAGAAAAGCLIFIPSFLLVFALLPVFDGLRANRAAAAALRGANAAVVGLLGALLYSPLLLALATSIWRIGIALAVFVLVTVWKTPPWIAVLIAALAGAAAGAGGRLG